MADIHGFIRWSVSSFSKDNADLVTAAEMNIPQMLGKVDLEVLYPPIQSTYFNSDIRNTASSWNRTNNEPKLLLPFK